MFVNKNFGVKGLWAFTGHHFVWLTVWMGGIAALHELTHWEWMKIPWLPVSIIGTAVAFYVGFKNNQSYDRLWEARKIWGAIVNTSRAWSTTVKNFVSNQFTETDRSQEDLQAVRRRLVKRHIAWLYTLRSQLLIPERWEHINQGMRIGRMAERRQKRFGVGLFDDGETKDKLKQYIPSEEYERMVNYKNTATQLIDRQGEELKDLRGENLIDDFRHMELQALLEKFYDHQGKCERIKKFPLPRQYGNMSFIFVAIFIFLLPFGMIDLFHDATEYGVWLSIPFNMIVAWVFLVMELVGDYSENPFEGLGNDIPMLALCRTIEIDLLEMLGEQDVPEPITPKNGVLM